LTLTIAKTSNIATFVILFE